MVVSLETSATKPKTTIVCFSNISRIADKTVCVYMTKTDKTAVLACTGAAHIKHSNCEVWQGMVSQDRGIKDRVGMQDNKDRVGMVVLKEEINWCFNGFKLWMLTEVDISMP